MFRLREIKALFLPFSFELSQAWTDFPDLAMTPEAISTLRAS